MNISNTVTRNNCFFKCLLLFLSLIQLHAYAQTSWNPDDIKQGTDLNGLVLQEIKTNSPYYTFLAVSSHIDTVSLRRTIARYAPEVGRNDLSLNTVTNKFQEGAWGEVHLFINEWNSRDSSERIRINVNIAKYKGLFYIIRMDFDGNIHSLLPPESHLADSVNALLVIAVRKKNYSAFNTLFRPESSLDQSLLSKTISHFDSLIRDSAFTYTYDNSMPAEVFPVYYSYWSAAIGNNWTNSTTAEAYYITVYIDNSSGIPLVSQAVFGSEKKGSPMTLFPGGIYDPGDNDFPPPPPPPPLPH